MKFNQILPHFISGRPITRKRFQLKHKQCKTYCFISEIRDGKRWIAVGDSYSEPRYYDHFSLADVFADDWEVNQHFVPREWHRKHGVKGE